MDAWHSPIQCLWPMLIIMCLQFIQINDILNDEFFKTSMEVPLESQSKHPHMHAHSLGPSLPRKHTHFFRHSHTHTRTHFFASHTHTLRLSLSLSRSALTHTWQSGAGKACAVQTSEKTEADSFSLWQQMKRARTTKEGGRGRSEGWTFVLVHAGRMPLARVRSRCMKTSALLPTLPTGFPPPPTP
jgi:hypothetical protein